MDVFRTPSTPSNSDILPTYSLEANAAVKDQAHGNGEVPLSSSSSPAAAASNPWAREKARRDPSEYRNSVVLVDEQSGEVVGVLGRAGGVVLDEEQPSSSPSQEVEPATESTLSTRAVVGISPSIPEGSSQITSENENDFFVDTTNSANNDLTPASSSLQRGLNLLDQRTGPIDPYPSAPTPTPTPSILLTASPSTSALPSGLPPAPPPTPIFPSSSSKRPSSSLTYHDLRTSPSDISLRTLLGPRGHSQLGMAAAAGLPDLGPSGTTIRRVHSRRMRSGTVTSVGGSSFYTAREPGGGDGGTWRGSVMMGGSVRGGILGGREEGEGGKREGRVGEGEVLLRFFEERESVFVASQSQPSAPSPLASAASTPALDSPESATSSLPEEPNLLTPTDSASPFWSYFSIPSQPLAGASLVWDASRDFFGNVWDLLDFSTAPDDSSTSPQHPSGRGHGRYRSSFYYHPNPPSSPSQLRAVDPDSLDSVRPEVVMKRGRIPTDYGSETEERRRVDVWHVDELGVGRRAWIGPGGLGGVGGGMDGMGFC